MNNEKPQTNKFCYRTMKKIPPVWEACTLKRGAKTNHTNPAVHNKTGVLEAQENQATSHPLADSLRAGQRRLRTETSLLTIQPAQINQMPRKIALQANGNSPSYAELICTEKDKSLIAELTSTLAEHNYFWFVVHAQELKKKVKVFKNRVHVLKILEAVFTNSKLKKDIIEIYNDSTKWDAVVNETNKKMRKKEEKGLLHIYMNDFAIAIGVPPQEIQGYFLRKDWEGLLTYLVNRVK